MLHLQMSQFEYKPGETVAVTLTLSNRTAAAQTYELGNPKRFDVLVLHNGREVWSWSSTPYYQKELGDRKLKPGESVVYRVEWPQVNAQGRQVPDGFYVISAMISTASSNAQASTSVMIG